MPQRLAGRTFTAVAVALSLVLLAGCSLGESEASKGYKALNPDFRMEQANQQVACMKDKGFTVLPDAQGGVRFGNDEVPEDQLDLAMAAIRDCSEELGFNDAPKISTEQLHKLYALNVEAAKCLEALDIFGDIKVKVAEAPSEQTFVDTFHNPGEDGPPWSPWGLDTMKQLRGIDEKVVDQARLTCPDPLNYATTL